MPKIEFDSRFVASPPVPQEVQPLADSDGFITQNLSRSEWIDLQLTRTFIANSVTALLALLAAVPVTLASLAGFVPSLTLACWTLLIGVMAAYRWWIIVRYRAGFSGNRGIALQRFFSRHVWTWPVSGMLWSGLMFTYINKVPVDNQFLCMLVLVGMASSAVGLMSSRIRVFESYIDGLCGVSVLAVAWFVYSTPDRSMQWPDLGLIFLMVFFWGLLRRMGKRFHTVQRRGYELQYDNEQLIASLRERSQAAIEAVQIKDRLLANATHDLRQPVHALAFYADWLRSEPSLVTEVVPKILQATDSVNALFNSLFDFAKIEANGVAPKFEQVPVSQVLNDLKLQFEPSAKAKGLELRLHVQAAYIWTDPILIRRIVGNLVGNAIRYTDKGAVLLSTRKRGEDMWIEVRDTGVGIGAEHLPHIFREFYKASSHSGTGDGFGLGLAIVNRLCAAMGHEISLRSYVGRGTAVRISVPITQLVANSSLRRELPSGDYADGEDFK